MTSSSSSMNTNEYLSEVRHELKNHLSVILAFSELAIKKRAGSVNTQITTPDTQEEQLSSYLQKIMQRAKKMVMEVEEKLSDQAIQENCR